MMDGPGGPTLTNESIQEAVAFRQTMGRVHRQFTEKRDWFFRTWNADTVPGGKASKKVPFEDASPDQLATDPECWVLHPREAWHGFGDLEDDYCMLDPIKVSILTPGVADKGGLDKRGIPASLVTSYLHYKGVEVEKTTDFTILFLFSIGITKGKWGTLLNSLLDFKRDYDSNAPVAQVLPHLTADVYNNLGLREVADLMFAQLKESRQTHWLAEAFSTLPKPVMTPNARVPVSGTRRDRARAARETRQPRARHERRAIPAGHSHAHAWRINRREGWPVSRLPAGTLVVGQAFPGVRS